MRTRNDMILAAKLMAVNLEIEATPPEDRETLKMLLLIKDIIISLMGESVARQYLGELETFANAKETGKRH